MPRRRLFAEIRSAAGATTIATTTYTDGTSSQLATTNNGDGTETVVTTDRDGHRRTCTRIIGSALVNGAAELLVASRRIVWRGASAP